MSQCSREHLTIGFANLSLNEIDCSLNIKHNWLNLATVFRSVEHKERSRMRHLIMFNDTNHLTCHLSFCDISSFTYISLSFASIFPSHLTCSLCSFFPWPLLWLFQTSLWHFSSLLSCPILSHHPLYLLSPCLCQCVISIWIHPVHEVLASVSLPGLLWIYNILYVQKLNMDTFFSHLPLEFVV